MAGQTVSFLYNGTNEAALCTRERKKRHFTVGLSF